MERINFNMTKLKDERPTEVIEAFISLSDDYLEYKTDYYADKRNLEDEMMPWREGVYSYLHEVVSKEAIKGIYLSYRDAIDQWKINIGATGVENDLFIMCETETEAKKLFSKLMGWKYKK